VTVVNGAVKVVILVQAHVFVKALVGIALIIAVQLVVLFRLLLIVSEHLQAQQLGQLYTVFQVLWAAVA
jgi:hypothetical protein